MSRSSSLSNPQAMLLFFAVVAIFAASTRSIYLLFILNGTGRPTLTEAASFISQNFINFGINSGWMFLAEIPLVIFACFFGLIATGVILMAALMLLSSLKRTFSVPETYGQPHPSRRP